MTEAYKIILSAIKEKFRAEIAEADDNPNKWFELFILKGEDKESETVACGKTFDGVCRWFEKYATLHGLDNVHIDIWQGGDTPSNIQSVYCVKLAYQSLKKWLKDTGQLSNMKMIGECEFPCPKSNPVFVKDYGGTTDECHVYFDEVAFKYFCDLVCYIPEHGEIDDPEDWTTHNEILEVCEGRADRAASMFEILEWEHPTTLYQQWETNGTLDEDEDDAEDQKRERIETLIRENRHPERYELDRFIDDKLESIADDTTDDDILTEFDEWLEDADLYYEKIRDQNYYASL